MSRVSTAPRAPSRSLQEEAEMRAQDLRGLEVIEGSAEAIRLFAFEFGRVRTDKVVKPIGMPPAEWVLA